jgi:hypothetical protein
MLPFHHMILLPLNILSPCPLPYFNLKLVNLATSCHQTHEKMTVYIYTVDQRKKRQDTKATQKWKPKPPHPIVAVTQDINYTDPSNNSTLTPSVTSPPFVPTSTPNATIKTLIRREGSVGSTKPVTITTTNTLAWFHENAEAPLSGTSETLYHGARNLFQPVQYEVHTSDNFTTKNLSSSSTCTSPSIEAQLQNHISNICQ